MVAKVDKLKKLQSSKFYKRFLKITVLAYIYQMVTFGDLVSCASKGIFKNVPYGAYAMKFLRGFQPPLFKAANP